MPKSNKPYRVRVRASNGVPTNWKTLKTQLGAHLDVFDVAGGIEFVVCAVNEKQIEQVRAKLGGAGLEPVVGDTAIHVLPETRPINDRAARGRPAERRPDARRIQDQPRQPRHQSQRQQQWDEITKRPYHFVALPKELTTARPVWHDGSAARDCLSGEIRFELETLTPLLVGWERAAAGAGEGEPWPLPQTLVGVGELAADKSVLCPLRAPWGRRPVVIPGDSLKGLLRHELGALLGAPMERVAERSYSYRPNSMFAANAQRIPRIARIPEGAVEIRLLDGHPVRVPKALELLPAHLKYDKRREQSSNYYRFDDGNGAPYRGGQGAGKDLNSKRRLHARLTANPSMPTQRVEVPEAVKEGYLATVRHLTDVASGHFSERHPDVPTKIPGDDARKRILDAAANVVFQPGDLIWVEWDTVKNRIVSFGWHYYYRWAYVDSVRYRGRKRLERHGLFPLPEELEKDVAGAPKRLSAVRRLFGYTGDNDGCKGIGEGDHSQLMGRISVNAALEVVADTESDQDRFLPPTYLRELGMPRPSAVEYYLKQPYYPNPRPSDNAPLVTYGDADGYDTAGELAGRKVYLDRADAYKNQSVWEDASDTNRRNDRSTLALEASKCGRRFRFTLRFRDLERAELAAIMVALCPHQLRDVLGGRHEHGYCSKMGYARPLGWGSVRIEAKALLLLDEAEGGPSLNAVPDVVAWVKGSYDRRLAAMQEEWLDVHRHRHPNASGYRTKTDRDGKEQVYAFHTALRAEHARARRYDNRRNR